jgi:hypothetical protein
MRRLGVIVTVVLGMAACNNFTDDGAAVILRISRVEGGSGFTGTNITYADQLFSDIRTCGTFINDNARLTMQVLAKNPNFVDKNDFTVNDVTVESYQVRYVRSDGHSVEGVDVPYSFRAGMNTLVRLNATGTTQAAVVVVRHQAKLEAPLKTYLEAGNEELVTMTAVITVYGRTTSGDGVQAEGRLFITFGDWTETNCPE